MNHLTVTESRPWLAWAKRATVAAVAALAAAATMAGGLHVNTRAYAANEDPTADEIDQPFNYYSDVSGLETDHVFENITIERLQDILSSGNGNYAILFGGTWDSNVTKALPVIDKVAKAKGITKVYNFDPHLDNNAWGSTLVDVNDKNNAISQFATRFQEVIDKFGLKSLQSKDTSKVVDLPTLFTYNKANADTVIASTNALPTDANYEQTVNGVLAGIANTSAVRTNAQFFSSEINARKNAKVFKDAEVDGSDAAFSKDFALHSVTYGELVKLLKSDGNHFIFFGATWCPNTTATIRYVNQEAAKYGVQHVYTFDTILDAATGDQTASLGKKSAFHIRDNYDAKAHPLADLYTKLVNTYLPNLITEDGSKSVKGSDGVGATRLQVPLLLHYNASNTATSAGTVQPAGPITDEVVGYQGYDRYDVSKSTAREYMLYWEATTYDDSAIIAPYIFQPSELTDTVNWGRTPSNDRDSYIAQADHFFSTIKLRQTVSDAENVENGEYSDSSWSTFTAALNNAKDVLAKAATLGTAIDGEQGTDKAASTLLTAKSALTTVDTSALIAAINAANKLDKGKYTADSWKALADAKSEGELLLNKSDFSQKQADDAATAIRDAITGLVVNKTVAIDSKTSGTVHHVTDGEPLADTGSSSMVVIVASVALLLAGAGALAVRRFSRR